MRSMCSFAAALALLAVPALVVASAPSPTPMPAPAPELEVTAHIPADPLFVWAVKTESAAAELDAVLGLVAEIIPAEEGFDAEAGLAKVDAKLGVSLRNDLLARLGPELISGRFFTGMVAAIAIPNMLNAVERGRTKRSMADMRSMATSMEAYAVDNDHYPPLQGWVDPGALAAVVSPTYIRTVPAIDGWDHPYKVFSDGQHYAIVSAGPNGVVDHEWTPPIDATVDLSATDDIVYADGTFLSDTEAAERPE